MKSSYRKLARGIYLPLYFTRSIFFIKKLITSEKDLEKAYSMRGDIFGILLKWVKLDNKNWDIDEYDNYAIHLGVFDKSKIIAYCRIIRGDRTFMLEKDFKPLIGGLKIRKKMDTIEITRLTVAKEYIGNIYGEVLQLILYRELYRWSLRNNVRYWYFVVRKKYFEKIKDYSGGKQIGKPYSFDGGEEAVAAVIDLTETNEFLRKKNWLLYKWYNGFFN